MRFEPASRLTAVGNTQIVAGNTQIDSDSTLTGLRGSLAKLKYFGRGRQ